VGNDKGNALGIRRQHMTKALKGRNNRSRRYLCRPYRARLGTNPHTQGVALGYHITALQAEQPEPIALSSGHSGREPLTVYFPFLPGRLVLLRLARHRDQPARCSCRGVYVTGADAPLPHWSVMALCWTISFYFGSRS